MHFPPMYQPTSTDITLCLSNVLKNISEENSPLLPDKVRACDVVFGTQGKRRDIDNETQGTSKLYDSVDRWGYSWYNSNCRSSYAQSLIKALKNDNPDIKFYETREKDALNELKDEDLDKKIRNLFADRVKKYRFKKRF